MTRKEANVGARGTSRRPKTDLMCHGANPHVYGANPHVKEV